MVQCRPGPAASVGIRMAVVVAFSALGGCSSDLGLPASAQVACAGGGCPDGWVCRPELQRCVRVGGLDTEAPRLLGDPKVVPDVGTRSTPFVVTFVASEDLARPPEVTADGVALRLVERDGRSWTYEYLPRGDEAEGEVPVVATLVDRAGNAAEGLACGAVVFDVTPPSVIGDTIRIEPARAGPRTTVEVAFGLDEPASATEVLVGGRPATPVDDAGGLQRFAYRVAGDEAEGPVDVEATLEDPAGNVRPDVALGRVTFDFTAPVVEGREVPGRVLRPGEVVSVGVTFSEEAVGEPEVSLTRADGAQLVLDRVLVSRVSHSYLHTIREDDGGTWSAALRHLADAAGNEADEVDLGEVRIDAAPPALVDDTVRVLDGVCLRTGGTVRVAFATTEPVASPEVGLELAGGAALPLREESAEPAGPGTRYVYARVVEDGHPQGVGHVSVGLQDVVGNRGGPWRSEPVTVDDTPPEVGVDDLSVRPADVVGLGQLFEVELVAPEALLAATIRSIPPGPDLGPAVISGPRAIWTRLTREDDASGPVGLAATLSDLAGNEATLVVPEALRLDLDAPGVLPDTIRVGPSPRRNGGRLTVEIDTDEPLEGPAIVRIGDVRARLVAADGDRHFEYEHIVDAAVEPEGPRHVVATLRDLAGNAAEAPLGEVAYDFTAPRLNGIPSLERCDGRAPARMAPNDLWVGRPDCPEGSPAVRVWFTLSEPLPEGAWPRVTVAGREWSREPDLSEPPLYVAAYDPAGAEPESSPAEPAGQTVFAEAEDAAGNKARLPLGTLRFDFTAPVVAADEATLAGLRHVRDPWGSDGSGYVPRMHVEVAGDAFDEPGEVRIWRVSDLAPAGTDPEGAVYGRSLLGSGEFTPGERIEAEAGAIDHPLVHFTFTDRAGNESDADLARGGTQGLPVAAGEWVGTLNGRIVGDARSNPHVLRMGYSEGDDPLALDTDTWPAWQQGPYTRVARLDAVGAVADMSYVPWRDASGYSSPPEREEPGLAFDSGRGRLVLFGGRAEWRGACGPADTRSCSDTWEWDGRRWMRRYPHRSPPPLDDVFLFDDPEGGVLLVGGAGGAEIWHWDGHEWARRPSVDPPPPRWDYAAAYDVDRRVVVLFGGTDPDWRCEPAFGSYCEDVWEWDGERWTQRQPEVRPPGRIGHEAVYDGARAVTLVVGGARPMWGCHGEDDACADVWSWDGEAWTQIDPGDFAAPGEGHLLGYDPARRVVVVEDLLETWEWDGLAWRQRREPDDDVPNHTWGAMAYDSRRGRTVAFGGRCYRSSFAPWTCDAVWSWDGQRWTSSVSGPPPGRSLAASSYDPERRTVLLFGGSEVSMYGTIRSPTNDVWEWDGEGWTERTPEGGEAPSGRFGSTLAWDPARQRTVLFGGCEWSYSYSSFGRCRRGLQDTWEWDGDGWQEVNAGFFAWPPEERFGHAMATSPTGSGVVLFGGLAPDFGDAVGDDTWIRDEGRWSGHAIEPAPGARYLHAMTLDAARGVVVLFGGVRTLPGACEDGECRGTWEWDGGAWTRREPATAPPTTVDHRLAWDATRRRVVMFGGTAWTGSGWTAGGHWEWDGVDWTPLYPAVPGPARSRHVMVWDAARDELVMHGGDGYCYDPVRRSRHCVRTWLYAPQRFRPHVTVGFDLERARTIRPSSADPSTKALLSASIRLRAGGLGHTWQPGGAAGEAVPGFSVSASAFGRGGWVPLYESLVATVEAPEDWSGSFDAAWRCDEDWCAGLTPADWVGPDGMVHLDVTPLTPRGAGGDDGLVGVDYAELRLRYWRTGCERPSDRLPEGTPDDTVCADGRPDTAGERCVGGECVAP